MAFFLVSVHSFWIFFFNLVSVNQTECWTIPACRRFICFFNKAIPKARVCSWKNCVWCLNFLFYIWVWIAVVDLTREMVYILEEFWGEHLLMTEFDRLNPFAATNFVFLMQFLPRSRSLKKRLRWPKLLLLRSLFHVRTGKKLEFHQEIIRYTRRRRWHHMSKWHHMTS